MVYKTIFTIALGGLFFCGCSQKKDLKMWETANVVATRSVVNGQDFITLDPSLLKDSIVFPISHFMDEINFVKLDDSEEALIYPAPVEISENYILVKSGRPRNANWNASVPIPCKLFDINGKFISDIGAIGQGPGEYTMIYSMQIDEKKERVYLMPWQTDKILVYDLKGNLQEPIPMAYKAPKAIFKVDGDKVAIAIIPFPGNPSVAWVQNLDGEVIGEVPTGHFEVSDFSNEVLSSQNTNDMDISFWNWPARVDSLYHLDMQTGSFIPKLTMNLDADAPKDHSYVEWSNYYVGTTQSYVTISRGGETSTEGDKPAFYILDKETLKGAFLVIENDYLDGKKVEWPSGIFDKGYYSINIEPGVLLEWIEQILKSDKVNDKMRTKLTELQTSIDENDNNYILYAKMKK